MISPPTTAPPRLLSLDALRGFDMLWIVGGENIVHGLGRLGDNALLRLVLPQLSHKPWAGFAFYDLIFPLFVFMAGVSIVFSLGRVREKHGTAGAIRRILTRGILLYLVGLFYYGGISKGFDQVRVLGVLQRIAIAYTFAALLFTLLRLRGLIIACGALLIGYWAIMTFVPIRDINLETSALKQLVTQSGGASATDLFARTTTYVTGKFDPGLNLANHFDFQYLGGRRHNGAYDPEGILSTIPAIATCLFGVFAGLLIRCKTYNDQKKVLWLLGAGATSVALGFLWGLQFPVIKKIWTSSFVLVAGGYSCLLLGLFHQTIEVWQIRRWTTPFVWIGVNPMAVYLAHNFIDFNSLASRVVGGPIENAMGPGGPLLVTVVGLGITLLMLRFMYQRKIFLRL